MREWTAVIVVLVIETTRRPGYSPSTTLSRPWGNFLHQTLYCWSCKILVTIYWTHSDWNDICTKSFCPQQTNNRRLFLVGWLQWQRCHI